MSVNRMCKDCGKSIIVFSTLQNKCPKCTEKRLIAKYPTKECKQCGKQYNVRRPSLLSTSKFCSQKCQGEAKKNRVIRKCKVCYKEFEFKPSQSNAYKNAGVACSRKCASEYVVRKNANAPINDKYQRTRRKADKEWQKAVRERDGYTCKRCGTFGLHIDTHHIALRSQRPDLRHVVSNGVCLCRSCHQWVHHHPKEAKKLGFISDERYGVAEKLKRSRNVSIAKTKNHQLKTDGKL